MKKLKQFSFVMVIVFLISSCAKDGKDGLQGPQGDPGTANVTAVVFSNPAWSGSLINLTVPQITDEIFNSGTVLAYMKFTSVSNVYYHVPGLVVNSAYQMRVYHQVGAMRFNLQAPDGGVATGTAPEVTSIKIVIIPAGSTVNGRTSGNNNDLLVQLRNAGVNVDNYEEVARYFGL